MVVQDRSIQVPSATNAFFVAPGEEIGGKEKGVEILRGFWGLKEGVFGVQKGVFGVQKGGFGV